MAHHFERGGEVKAKLSSLLSTSEWDLYKAEGGTQVFHRDDASGFWLKVEATFDPRDMKGLRDVLDTHLLQRQAEWHDLLLPGGSVTSVGETEAMQLCYFAYSSPWPMSARDCLYAKERTVDADDELVLLYWTVRDDSLKPPVTDMVRIDFQAAHRVKCVDSKCKYTYIQRSDAKVHLPDMVLKKIQVDIVIQEVKGLRRAVARQ